MKETKANINKNPIKSLLITCFIVAALILIGVGIPIFNVVALIIACVYIIFSKKITNIISLLLFLLAFSPIFKLNPDGYTFFNFLIMVAIIKLLIGIKSLNLQYKEIFALTFFMIYIITFGGVAAVEPLLKISMYFVLLLLIFKHEGNIYLRNILAFFSFGIVFTSIAALFSEYIPGLSLYMSEVSLKLGAGDYFNRFSGIQENPNYYTMDISLALAGWFALVVNKKSNMLDYLFIVALSVLGIMSLSQSFIIIYILLIIFLLFSYAKQNVVGLLKGVFFIMVIFLGIYFLVEKETIEAFLSRINIGNNLSSDLSDITTGRSDRWFIYLEYIVSNINVFLFGEGLGGNNYASISPHNYFIEIFYYLGILGSFLYLIVLKVIFPSHKPNFKRKLANYLPFIVLLIRSMAISLLVQESLIFYFIIIMIVMNTNFNEKDNLEEYVS